MPNALKGVAFNAPPTSLLADATKLIDQMAAGLPPDTSGAVVASWIGKSWSGLTGGAAVRASW